MTTKELYDSCNNKFLIHNSLILIRDINNYKLIKENKLDNEELIAFYNEVLSHCRQMNNKIASNVSYTLLKDWSDVVYKIMIEYSKYFDATHDKLRDCLDVANDKENINKSKIVNDKVSELLKIISKEALINVIKNK